MKETTKQVLVAGGVAVSTVYGGFATQLETTFPAVQEHGATPYYGGAAAAAAGAWYFWKKKPMVAAALAGLGLAAAYEGFQRSSVPAPAAPQATPQLGGAVAPALPARQGTGFTPGTIHLDPARGTLPSYSGTVGLLPAGSEGGYVTDDGVMRPVTEVHDLPSESGVTYTNQGIPVTQMQESTSQAQTLEEEPGFFDRLSDWWSDEDGGAVVRPRGRGGLGGGFGGLMG